MADVGHIERHRPRKPVRPQIVKTPPIEVDGTERLNGFKGLTGRGSWIRTNDLQYPKLPRYQAALYPELFVGA
jgi:hypothetical protein